MYLTSSLLPQHEEENCLTLGEHFVVRRAPRSWSPSPLTPLPYNRRQRVKVYLPEVLHRRHDQLPAIWHSLRRRRHLWLLVRVAVREGGAGGAAQEKAKAVQRLLY